MCVTDNNYILRVDNIGPGAVVSELVGGLATKWSVRLPQILQSRGPCHITVIDGFIGAQRLALTDVVADIWLDSNIPVQGAIATTSQSSQPGSMTQLFAVSPFTYAEGDTPANYKMSMPARPRSFVCAGLPNIIEFEANCWLYATAKNGTAYTVKKMTEANALSCQISFTLSIVFYSDMKSMP